MPSFASTPGKRLVMPRRATAGTTPAAACGARTALCVVAAVIGIPRLVRVGRRPAPPRKSKGRGRAPPLGNPKCVDLFLVDGGGGHQGVYPFSVPDRLNLQLAVHDLVANGHHRRPHVVGDMAGL